MEVTEDNHYIDAARSSSGLAISAEFQRWSGEIVSSIVPRNTSSMKQLCPVCADIYGEMKFKVHAGNDDN